MRHVSLSTFSLLDWLITSSSTEALSFNFYLTELLDAEVEIVN